MDSSTELFKPQPTHDDPESAQVKLSPDLTINQTERERVSTNSRLTFPEVLLQSRTMPFKPLFELQWWHEFTT